MSPTSTYTGSFPSLGINPIGPDAGSDLRITITPIIMMLLPVTEMLIPEVAQGSDTSSGADSTGAGDHTTSDGTGTSGGDHTSGSGTGSGSENGTTVTP